MSSKKVNQGFFRLMSKKNTIKIMLVLLHGSIMSPEKENQGF